jgi:hypothetical protein
MIKVKTKNILSMNNTKKKKKKIFTKKKKKKKKKKMKQKFILKRDIAVKNKKQNIYIYSLYPIYIG